MLTMILNLGYAIEILPYTLRAKGMMIMNFCVQIALTLNTYANPVAFEFFDPHTWKLYLIYTVSLCSMVFPPLISQAVADSECRQCWVGFELGFVYFFYVETKGPTLEELAKVIDGDRAAVARLDLHQVEKETDIIAHEEFITGKA